VVIDVEMFIIRTRGRCFRGEWGIVTECCPKAGGWYILTVFCAQNRM